MTKENQPQQSEEEQKEMQITEQKYREISLKRHMTVRIPRGIAKAIEEFLKTEQAAKMGFDSKADVVTTAVRRLLMEYGYYNIKKREEQKQQEPRRITQK